MVERLVGWFDWILVEVNLCSSSFSPAIVTNLQFIARDSFFARRSFVSFPKMFPLQEGREVAASLLFIALPSMVSETTNLKSFLGMASRREERKSGSKRKRVVFVLIS
jgi:hypothetical protein